MDLGKKMMAVGRNLAKAQYQSASSKVPMNLNSGKDVGSSFSKGDKRPSSGGGIQVRGGGAAQRGTRARGTMG